MNTKEEKLQQFSHLLDIMNQLIDKCPWNKAQTMDSLRTLTIEEVYELSDAILKNSTEDIKKELGDLMLHIVFYCAIACKDNKFDVADVLATINDKMVFRHPHVFSDNTKSSAEEVADTWELIKMKEKGANKRILSGIADSLPPIIKAYSMQDKARGVGFDWQNKQDVWAKVKEEQMELEVELNALDNYSNGAEKEVAIKKAEGELGDVLFSIINAARLYGLNPDTALNRTCDKFRRRFTYLEEQTIRKGRSLKDMSLNEMDIIWKEAKNKGL